MSEAERTITELENAFPSLSEVAFRRAREEAFAAGQSVYFSEDGIVYEAFPDGTRMERLRIEPPTPILPGTKVVLR